MSEAENSTRSSLHDMPLHAGDHAENEHTDAEGSHSEILGASELNDHRNHQSLPVRKHKQEMSSTDLRNKMLVDEDNDEYAVQFNDRFKSGLSFTNTPVPAPIVNRRHSIKSIRSRSRSFGDQMKTLMPVGTGLLHTNPSAANSPLMKTISRGSSSRRNSRAVPLNNTNNGGDDSDVDSHASIESEEDVCFPMLPDNINLTGIDFNELDEYIEEQREENEAIFRREKELKHSNNRTSSAEKMSSAALKYTPKSMFASSNSNDSASNYNEKFDDSNESEPGVTFDSNGNKFEDSVPTRFSFFRSDKEETLHTADLTTLVNPNESIQGLFGGEDSIWWLDCTCPTDVEMKVIAKAFGIHPLTAEDIRMQETREKIELFKSYYFVCFHTFETDQESEDFLEPINVYLVVFKTGILTFHFSPIVNPANVRRRVRQLRDYVTVSADWLCYAMIDDITDGFAPIIHSIEYEADSIEDSVFMNKDNDFREMLLRIGESRRKVMTLMRLLQGKADVIKMFSKRCQEEIGVQTSAAQPRADIALYLGDIQDHIITMFQSLLSFEKIFSRSHSNYLAQLQVESFYINNKVTDILSKVTMLGTILVPMNLVTGLFGMNVKVPGNDQTNYGWFGGIIGFIFLMILVSICLVNLYVNKMNEKTATLLPPLSVKDFKIGKQRAKKSDGLFGSPKNRSDMRSLPTKFTKYGDW